MTENEQKLNEAVNQIARAQVELLDKIEPMIQKAVKEFVNGKIDRIDAKLDAHNVKHEADMEDLRPIIKDYKQKAAFEAEAKRLGGKVSWWAGLVTSIGVLYLFAKGIWK